MSLGFLRASKHVVLCEVSSYFQVLQEYQVVPAAVVCRFLVQEIVALVVDAFVQSGQHVLCFLSWLLLPICLLDTLL